MSEIDDEGADPGKDLVEDDWEDDWDDEDDPRPGGRRDLTLILSIAVAVLVIALVVVLTRPKDKTTTTTSPDPASGQTTQAGKATQPVPQNWQGPVADGVGDVQGRIAKGAGVYLWTDFKGWHVRNTTSAAVKVKVEADSVVTTGPDGKKSGDPKPTAEVTVAPGDFKTGVDFDLGFSSKVTVTVSNDAGPLPSADLKLGGSGQATENPVTFTKA